MDVRKNEVLTEFFRVLEGNDSENNNKPSVQACW